MNPEALETALLEALRAGVPIGSVDRLTPLLPRGADTALIAFLNQTFVPALERAIVAGAPVPRLADDASVPAPEINVIEAAELLLAVNRLTDGAGTTGDAARSVADAIIVEVDRFGAELAARLAADAAPDMRRLTHELGKLEGLRWLLLTLQAHDHHRTLSTQLQVAARRALRRATATIESFLAERRAAARQATAAVTGEIEGLVSLVLLLLDAEREDAIAEADNVFFNALSGGEVASFADRATALAELMFDELDGLAGSDPQAEAFARPLRQVMTLASFARRLDGYVTVDAVLRLGDTIARRRAALEARRGGLLRPLS